MGSLDWQAWSDLKKKKKKKEQQEDSNRHLPEEDIQTEKTWKYMLKGVKLCITIFQTCLELSTKAEYLYTSYDPEIQS